MDAIIQLYRNLDLVTKNDYIKVRDGLWVKSGPYKEKSWNKTDKSILPTKDELNEIYLKFQEIILIQEACGLESLQQILEEDDRSWIWSSTEYDDTANANAWVQRMSAGYQYISNKYFDSWVVPVRRF